MKLGKGYILFQYIRDKGREQEDITVVYGLDADLIMLSLFHVDYTKNIFVCREAPAFCKGILSETLTDDTLLFLDISCLQTSIVTHICGQQNQTQNETRIVHDYIFLCFMLGNDFLPHFPTLNIRTHGMNLLLDTYRKYLLKSQKHLVDVENGQVFWKHVHYFFTLLVPTEHERFLQEHALRDKMEHQIKNNKKDAEDINNIPILYRKEEHYICPHEKGWKTRYYKALFGEDVAEGFTSTGGAVKPISSVDVDELRSSKSMDDEEMIFIKKVCKNYCEGLEWVFRYYTSNCPNWQWKYGYNYPPLFSDLVQYAPMQVTNQHRYIPKQYVYNPVTAHQQLMYVIPYSQASLIPGENVDVKKSKIRCVFAYCRYFWESHITVKVSYRES